MGTKFYQRLDIELLIGHEKSTIDMGQNTWTPNVIKGWTLNYVYVMKDRRYIWVRILGAKCYQRLDIKLDIGHEKPKKYICGRKTWDQTLSKDGH